VALTAGTVTVNPDASCTGSGLAMALGQALATAMKGCFGGSDMNAGTTQYVQDTANGLAMALVTYLTTNAEIDLSAVTPPLTGSAALK
jgi:hypothetical protein